MQAKYFLQKNIRCTLVYKYLDENISIKSKSDYVENKEETCI